MDVNIDDEGELVLFSFHVDVFFSFGRGEIEIEGDRKKNRREE